MSSIETRKTAPWFKKIFRLDFIIFALITFVFWIVLLYATGHSVGEHCPHDQYTVQAMAWRNGRIDVNERGEERAEYKGKIYVSFPPAPSFIELPLTLIFGSQTPNTITLLVFTWIAMLFSFFVLLKLTDNRSLSFLMSFSFFWGSQVLYLSLFGAVWHQGQLYGLFFAVSSLLILLYTEKPLPLIAGAFLLGLAVGCRPYYLVMALFYFFYAYKRFPKFSTILFMVAGILPPGLFYAIYNIIRFDSPFEFGHKYLEWYQTTKRGVINFDFFPRNLFYALINPPEWDKAKHLIVFNGMGTGLWFSSPVILLGFVYFFKSKLPTTEKIVSAITLAGVWGALLLHDTNGWFQFGYRFSVDLIPLALFLFGRTFKKDHWYLVLISTLSVIANIYGSIWFYIFYP
jgi:hypothetical protein